MELNARGTDLTTDGFGRSIRLALALAGFAFLAGCQGFIPASVTGQSPTELAEAVTEFRVIPASRAFINVPNALVVLERNLDGAVEQRITLPNASSLAGENVILLRAQTSRTASATRLVLSDVLIQFGGAPTPFTGITESGLTATSDQYGDITYTTLRPGGDLVCALAFRRTQIGSRALPTGASSLDIMMRNCASGALETALAPIGAAAFGLGSPLLR
jgi:hypothetical protein